jgi:2-haloacid dehalogenase
MAPAIKALYFDMFGTILDWRGSVARETEMILKPLGYSFDWGDFADAWRAEYRPSMNEVIDGKRPFVKLDVLHRENLEKVLPKFGVKDLDPAKIHDINMAWHRLDTWPEVPAAMIRLRKKFKIAPLSNGNISLMADVAKRNGFAFDAILGAEYAKIYKMQPGVYLASCEAFDLDPGECLMCAAHERDLAAAARTGMKTCFIFRPNEFGPGKGGAQPHEHVDMNVNSLAEVADQLGA